MTSRVGCPQPRRDHPTARPTKGPSNAAARGQPHCDELVPVRRERDPSSRWTTAAALRSITLSMPPGGVGATWPSGEPDYALLAVPNPIDSPSAAACRPASRTLFLTNRPGVG